MFNLGKLPRKYLVKFDILTSAQTNREGTFKEKQMKEKLIEWTLAVIIFGGIGVMLAWRGWAMKNPPAFPVTSDNYANITSTGMTLRDYFAAKAMQAYLPDAMEHNATENELAWSAYKMADAMMKAREAWTQNNSDARLVNCTTTA